MGPTSHREGCSGLFGAALFLVVVWVYISIKEALVVDDTAIEELKHEKMSEGHRHQCQFDRLKLLLTSISVQVSVSASQLKQLGS